MQTRRKKIDAPNYMTIDEAISKIGLVFFFSKIIFYNVKKKRIWMVSHQTNHCLRFWMVKKQILISFKKNNCFFFFEFLT